MNRKELEKAIEREVEEWPGVEVAFADPTGKGHPKAKFTFGGKVLAHTYAGTPSDSMFGIHQTLGDMRRTMRKLGAARAKADPSKDEDEAPYRKPNDGAAKRQSPIRSGPARVEPDLADKMVAAGAATAGQRTAARDIESLFAVEDDEDAEEADEIAAKVIAEFLARVDAIVDGIYFGLPDDVYHAVPRLSSSGIQRLCVSPATFWRNSWLDPERPAPGEDDTDARILGRAYHVARLEPHLFEQTYVRDLDKKDAPKGTLFTGDQMGALLAEMGLKKSGSVLEQAERLADNGIAEDRLWPLMRQQWEAARGTRISLPAKYYDPLVTDMDRIRTNEQIAPLLTGGEAEVSIFWTDEYGIKMKSRLDYLTREWWADFKTFDNSRQKNLDQCLADAVRYNRYYVQAVAYRDAVEAIRTGGLKIIESQTDDQRALIAHLQIKPGELACWYIFQEKGGVPNLLAREFPFYAVPYSTIFNEQVTDDLKRIAAVRDATSKRTQIHVLGAHEVLNAKRQFMLYSTVYPAGVPWFPIEARGAFTDEDFHPYWLAGDLR